MSKELSDYGSGVRGIFKYKDGKMVRQESKKRLSQAPAAITDEMEPIQSPIDPHGRKFDSRSAYKRHLKEHGFEITGGDHEADYRERAQTTAEREEEERRNKEEIEAAYMDVKYGRVPFTEEQKELFKREKEKWGENYNLKNPI